MANDSTELPRPETGEAATAQQVPASTNVANFLTSAAGVGDGFKGFDPPKAGTYDLYRTIERDPTVFLALVKLVSPIIGNTWVWKKRDKNDASLDEPLAKLKDWFSLARREQIVTDGLLALRRGYSPFEEVWNQVDDWILPDLKPLRVDYTTFLQDGKNIVGIRNAVPGITPVDLGPNKAFWFTFGGEAGNPYGEPLLENIRPEWSESDQIRRKVCKYINKVSGVIGQIHYPDGTSKDAAGADRSNFDIARQVAQAASEGKWLVFQNQYASFIADPSSMTGAQMEKALAAAGKSQWVVSFVDPGGTDHSGGFDTILRYYDALKVRGTGQPERGLLEGSHGTKAEAQSHGDVGTMFSALIDSKFAGAFNKGVLDDCLEFNVGKLARGAIYVEPAPLADDEYEAKLAIVNGLLANQVTAEATANKMDVDQVIEDLGVKVLEDNRGPLGDSIVIPPGLGKTAPAKPANGNRMAVLMAGAE